MTCQNDDYHVPAHKLLEVHDDLRKMILPMLADRGIFGRGRLLAVTAHFLAIVMQIVLSVLIFIAVFAAWELNKIQLTLTGYDILRAVHDHFTYVVCAVWPSIWTVDMLQIVHKAAKNMIADRGIVAEGRLHELIAIFLTLFGALGVAALLWKLSDTLFVLIEHDAFYYLPRAYAYVTLTLGAIVLARCVLRIVFRAVSRVYDFVMHHIKKDGATSH